MRWSFSRASFAAPASSLGPLASVLLPAGEDVFAGQAEHAPDPLTSLYVPAAHAAHGNAHFKQSVTSVPSLQTEASAQSPYRASSHSPSFAVLHVSSPRPAAAVYPALHAQLASAMLPAGELVPATRHTAHCQHQCAMCQHNLPKDVMAPPFRTREGDGEEEGKGLCISVRYS